MEIFQNVSISFNAGSYKKVSERKDCEAANLLITTKDECKKASGLLGLSFQVTYDLPADAPSKCGYDTQGMAYFNQANKNPGPTSMAGASFGGICKTKRKNYSYKNI